MIYWGKPLKKLCAHQTWVRMREHVQKFPEKKCFQLIKHTSKLFSIKKDFQFKYWFMILFLLSVFSIYLRKKFLYIRRDSSFALDLQRGWYFGLMFVSHGNIFYLTGVLASTYTIWRKSLLSWTISIVVFQFVMLLEVG